MAQSIAANDPLINSSTDVFIRLTTRIPSLAFRLLKILKEDREYTSEHFNDRSIKEYMSITQRARSSVQDAFAYLESIGFVGKKKEGSRAIRWITYEAFHYLESQPGHVSGHVFSTHSLYRSLKTEENKEILNKDQTLSVDNFEELEPEIKIERDPILESFLRLGIKEPQRMQIIAKAKRHNLPYEDFQGLAARIVAASKKSAPKWPQAYYLKAIENERQSKTL